MRHHGSVQEVKTSFEKEFLSFAAGKQSVKVWRGLTVQVPRNKQKCQSKCSWAGGNRASCAVATGFGSAVPTEGTSAGSGEPTDTCQPCV